MGCFCFCPVKKNQKESNKNESRDTSTILYSVYMSICARFLNICRNELTAKMRPLLRAAAAIPPLALRGDYWAPFTLLPYLVDALRHAGPGVQVRGHSF